MQTVPAVTTEMEMVKARTRETAMLVRETVTARLIYQIW
jgi:hypothetical protein